MPGKPFSAKKKKQQLQQRRQRKREKENRIEKKKKEEEQRKREIEKEEEEEDEEGEEEEEEDEEEGEEQNEEELEKKVPKFTYIRGDLRTVFEKESQEEIEKRKATARLPLNISNRSKPWSALQEYQLSPEYIDIPKRPPWNPNESKEEVERREESMFKKWIEDIYNNYPRDRLNYFEHNLEVWRQLWRVCERSDLVLLVTDARFPLFHFPPALYNYLVNDLKKPLLMVLNKQDLVDERILQDWTKYFHKNYPKLSLCYFSAFSLEDQRMYRSKKWKHSRGIDGLLNAINKVVQKEGIQKSKSEEDEEEGHIVVGLVGHPNVGKSSLINGLMGKKVVSASRTPGHTKHFQTIIYSEEIILCDCPGLVFPALDRPKALQILCGLFPIAQVREPYSAIRYLAERIPLEKHYGLQFPEDVDEKEWSPYLLCYAYAEKRGFMTAKSGRPDTHRAGLEILKDCVDGKIPISWPIEAEVRGDETTVKDKSETTVRPQQEKERLRYKARMKQEPPALLDDRKDTQEGSEEEEEDDAETILKKQQLRKQKKKMKKLQKKKVGLPLDDTE